MTTERTLPHTLALRDGTTLACRLLGADDVAGLQAFHATLSSRTTRMRFFSPKPRLSASEASDLCDIDVANRCAVVALDPAGRIVAVGRYMRYHDEPDTAEAAFVVADDWQGHGIGPALLDVLVGLARAEGITRLSADTLAENRAMRVVFERCALPSTMVRAYGLTHIELDLAA
jgi:RimJ/RimL family protein N-acetyltransferase